MNKGILIVVSGPSGVGKGTCIKQFIDDPELNLAYSVSMTTRKPRLDEVDGKNYHFVTRDRFQQAIDNGELLEWAEFVGNYYGTPLDSVNKLLEQGKNVILEIEVEGAKLVREKCPDSLTIFIAPPSLNELRNRIENRCTESIEVVQARLAKAEKEILLQCNYKYVVCNDDPTLASNIIKLIIKNHIK